MNDRPRILLVSEQPIWPADHGVSVRGYHLMQALRQRGEKVAVASVTPCPANAPAWVRGVDVPWPVASPSQCKTLCQGWRGDGLASHVLAPLRRRLASHQGVEPTTAAGIVTLVERLRPEVVLGLGLHSPLLLRGLSALPDGVRPRCVWYAADELIYYHLSCLRHDPVTRWPARLHEMTLHAMIETLFARGLDGAIGVSPTDTAWLRGVAGVREAVTIRNGVDLDYFSPVAPSQTVTQPQSLVFWGRLDFAPNIDAVCWFARAVWPDLRQRFPQATWHIVGHNPAPAVRKLAEQPGIALIGSVPDIRPHAHAAAITILPLRCGGGIKNKLLEAAAMARPIIASPRAVAGLNMSAGDTPAEVCDTPAQWIDAIARLWNTPPAAPPASLANGKEARAWAQRHHGWNTAGDDLLDWLNRLGWLEDEKMCVQESALLKRAA